MAIKEKNISVEFEDEAIDLVMELDGELHKALDELGKKNKEVINQFVRSNKLTKDQMEYLLNLAEENYQHLDAEHLISAYLGNR
jgi:hypothetical protein